MSDGVYLSSLEQFQMRVRWNCVPRQMAIRWRFDLNCFKSNTNATANKRWKKKLVQEEDRGDGPKGKRS